MKMKGDDTITWGDIADELMDPTITMEEDYMMYDEDPMGSYRGIPLSGDIDDDIDNNNNNDIDNNNDNNRGDVGIETNIKVEELNLEVMRLNEKVQNLENNLRAKDEENEILKLKILELETMLKQYESYKSLQLQQIDTKQMNTSILDGSSQQQTNLDFFDVA